MPLPAIPEIDDRRSLREWVDRFSGHVARLEFAPAAAMMDPGVISFSTFRDVVEGVEQFVDAQWRRVWPTIEDFRLDSAGMRATVSPDRLMAAVAVTWASTGFTEDQEPFDRPGRCTFVLIRDGIGRPWRGVQGHFSLYRGVPQQSHGRRPIPKG